MGTWNPSTTMPFKISACFWPTVHYWLAKRGKKWNKTSRHLRHHSIHAYPSLWTLTAKRHFLLDYLNGIAANKGSGGFTYNTPA